MDELIVAVFDTNLMANSAERDLQARGIPADRIRRYSPGDAGAPAISPTSTEHSSEHTSTTGHTGFWAWLFGDDEHHNNRYDETEYREHHAAGRVILAIRATDEAQATDLMEVLEKHAPSELDSHPHQAAQTPGGSVGQKTDPIAQTPGGGVSQMKTDPSAPARRDNLTEGEEVIPLAAESVEIGKRVVDRGTTRIKRYVVERPVDAEVALREETATIERRKPVTDTAVPNAAFEERTVEVRNTEEVPEVSKTARVAEEVVIHRSGRERMETVRANERKEEVEIENPVGKTGNQDQPTQRTGKI